MDNITTKMPNSNLIFKKEKNQELIDVNVVNHQNDCKTTAIFLTGAVNADLKH